VAELKLSCVIESRRLEVPAGRETADDIIDNHDNVVALFGGQSANQPITALAAVA